MKLGVVEKMLGKMGSSYGHISFYINVKFSRIKNKII